MEIENLISNNKPVADFSKWVDKFSDEIGIPYFKDNDHQKLIDMSYEEIVSLSSDECFATALILINYASHLQKKLDKIDTLLNYSTSLSNREISREWSNYDKYMPTEIKRSAIILNNSYLTDLEKIIIRLQCMHDTISETVKDLKRRVSLFQDFGKKRSFS